MSLWRLVLHLTVISFGSGQFVRPSSVLDSLHLLNKQQHGYRSIKAAVRSGWLSQRGSRAYGEHYDKRNSTALHASQVTLVPSKLQAASSRKILSAWKSFTSSSRGLFQVIHWRSEIAWVALT